jgi:hypothetical protein
MHHAKRYDETPDMRYIFYGADMTEAEKATAERLAIANHLNLGFGRLSVEFCASLGECTDALNASGFAHIGTSPRSEASRMSAAADGSGDAQMREGVAADGSDESADAFGESGARMKIALIDGSPKTGGSASRLISEYLREKIGASADCSVANAAEVGRGGVVGAAGDCDALVFIFPLYVDGIPSHLLRILDEARGGIAAVAPGATVYAVVNNGFYEGRQNLIALEMMRHFATRADLVWGRGIGVGAGGMIQSLTIGRGPLNRLGGALDTLAEDILIRASGEDYTMEPNFPRFLYKAAAHSGWRRAARKNGLTPRELYRK